MKILTLNKLELLKPDNDFIIIVDNLVYQKFSSSLKILEQHQQHLITIKLQASEKIKSMPTLLEVFKKINSVKCKKNTLLIAIGGGTILDLAGLVASLWMRGITWYALPTTVLSQVDSCYGGKTAINFEDRKNILGTIYPPEKIYLHHSFVTQLSKDLHFQGMSEVFKHALLKNDSTLRENIKQILEKNQTIALSLIKKSLQIKKFFVDLDLFEKKSSRIYLNLGHSIAHSLEQIASKKFTHGQALWWGLYLELLLSIKLGGKNLSPWLLAIQNYLMTRTYYKNQLSFIKNSIDTLIINSMDDKKNTQKSKLTFVALHAPGKPYVCKLAPKPCISYLKIKLQELN